MSQEVVNEGNSTARSYLDGRIRAFEMARNPRAGVQRQFFRIYLDGAAVGDVRTLAEVQAWVNGYREGVADRAADVGA